MLEEVSRGIDSVLDGSSSVYKKANEDFAKTVGLKDSYQKMVGKEIDLFSDVSAKALAEKARALTSRRKARPLITQTLKETDEVLNSFGVNFKDDIEALNFLSNRVEDMFKLAPDTGFQGSIGRAGQNLIDASVSPVAQARQVLGKASDMMKPDDAKKIKTLKLLTTPKGD
jgi:hypothetical protein